METRSEINDSQRLENTKCQIVQLPIRGHNKKARTFPIASSEANQYVPACLSIYEKTNYIKLLASSLNLLRSPFTRLI